MCKTPQQRRSQQAQMHVTLNSLQCICRGCISLNCACAGGQQSRCVSWGFKVHKNRTLLQTGAWRAMYANFSVPKGIMGWPQPF